MVAVGMPHHLFAGMASARAHILTYARPVAVSGENVEIDTKRCAPSQAGEPSRTWVGGLADAEPDLWDFRHLSSALNA